jgi:hypothetical protein
LRLTDAALDDYLAGIANLLDRYGIVLDLPGQALEIDNAATGARTFDLRGYLPDGRVPPGAIVELRETWIPERRGALERIEYVYELLDHERDFRLAHHLHDRDVFVRGFSVVVHDHCERPIGRIECAHFEGSPIRDAFAGVVALVSAWMADPPDCSSRRCLE